MIAGLVEMAVKVTGFNTNGLFQNLKFEELRTFQSHYSNYLLCEWTN